MATNIFEGARRIAKLGAVVAAGVTLIVLFNASPYISVNYSINQPDSRGVRIDIDKCNTTLEAMEWVTVTTEKGHAAYVPLCFVAQEFENGKRLVPFRVDPKDGRVWGNTPHSSEVSQYTSRVKDNFHLTPEDEEWVDKKWSSERWKEMLEGGFWLIGGLAAFFIFVWTIGWIVRGFLGIPRGQDHRTE